MRCKGMITKGMINDDMILFCINRRKDKNEWWKFARDR